MRATIETNGKTKTVKNLGWLLRNWMQIESLEWRSYGPAFERPADVHPITDGVFSAKMRDGRLYSTPYASFEVWQRFVKRPTFYGLPVTIDGVAGVIARKDGKEHIVAA